MPEDSPQLAFESHIAQLVTGAGEIIDSHERLRHLIRVNNDLTSHLDLPTVLRRIAEIAVEVVHAKYGAMGVIGPDGNLEQFIHAGMDEETVARIGHLPEGQGLLGVLIDHPTPVRLESISDDARSSGFPPHHPAMNSFLGVPIRVRDEVYGNLYLTEHIDGAFTADDEELAMALASTAGIAIANARLFQDALYREKWSAALAETARRLVSDESEEHLLELITQVKELADADVVCLGLLTARRDAIHIDRAVGSGAEQLTSQSYPLADSLAERALRSNRAIGVDDAAREDQRGFIEQADLEHAMVAPFNVHNEPAGVLSVARRRGRPAFRRLDIELIESFASHVSVSIERQEARENRRRMVLIEDRNRIARDLHDHVIQRLFATGLNLQAAAATIDPDTTPAKIQAQITEIDGAISQIRQSIFSLRQDAEVRSASLRSRVLEIIDRLQDEFARRPHVSFLGPVDLMADADLTDDIAAVVTEGLTNVIRHAHATTVDISVAAAAGQVTVTVTDDGDGPSDSPRRSGLENLRRRAEGRGGTFEISRIRSGGTRLQWSVPA